MTSSESSQFHLGTLAQLKPMMDALQGTCLSPDWKALPGTPTEHFNSNGMLFTTGSMPRDLWVKSALGGSMETVRASDGEQLRLIDLCSQTANTILGLNDPWVKLKQMAFLMSPYPHFVTIRLGNDLYYRVAKRILAVFDRWVTKPEEDGFVINHRQCNGSDAVELALHAAYRAASKTEGKRLLASFKGSYHGESLMASLVSEHQPGRVLVEKADNVNFHPAPRTKDGLPNGELTDEALATLQAIDRDGDKYFAVIIEPIQWRNAIHVTPLKFLEVLRDVCTRRNICLIFDELQNCFGYTGTITYAENCGVCPDIAVMSKALTGGHGSLGVIVARRKYRDLEGTLSGKSNSGDMLGLVAADAMLDRLLGVQPAEAEALPQWLPKQLLSELDPKSGGLLKTHYAPAVARMDKLLCRLQKEFPSIVADVRGAGLIRGLGMKDPKTGEPSVRLAAMAAKVCLEYGVYMRQADYAVLIKPALVVTDEECEVAYKAFCLTFEKMIASEGAN